MVRGLLGGFAFAEVDVGRFDGVVQGLSSGGVESTEYEIVDEVSQSQEAEYGEVDGKNDDTDSVDSDFEFVEDGPSPRL